MADKSKLYDKQGAKPGFDPEGEDYDYEGAKGAGLEPQFNPKPAMGEPGPRWPSRNPETGVLFKGKKHPTFQHGVDEDAKLGYKLRKRDDGRYETQKDE